MIRTVWEFLKQEMMLIKKKYVILRLYRLLWPMESKHTSVMKRTIPTFLVALSAIFLLNLTACSGDKAADSGKSEAKTAVGKVDPSALPNYRYVDIDTILAKYNLAKDYNEQMLRLQNSLQAKERQHQSNIQSFGQKMENKYKSGGYLSEASLNQDKQTLAGMQANAERDMNNSAQAAMSQQQAAEKAVMDSIKNYVDVYMASHKYDAIFLKNATLYINPQLDITDEIVEGLNARYNKKK